MQQKSAKAITWRVQYSVREEKMEDGKTPTFRKVLNPNFIVHPEGDYWEKVKPLKDKTALLIIDVQKHDQDLAVELRNAGNSYLYDRLNGMVIPNAQRLLSFFRDQQMVVTFATLGNQREDGRDRSPTQARPDQTRLELHPAQD